jgi:hypothetical protein
MKTKPDLDDLYLMHTSDQEPLSQGDGPPLDSLPFRPPKLSLVERPDSTTQAEPPASKKYRPAINPSDLRDAAGGGLRLALPSQYSRPRNQDKVTD